MCLDETNLKKTQEVRKNLKENQEIDITKEIKPYEKGKKSKKKFNEKKKFHDNIQKKNPKTKKKFYELSDEFFSEKIIEVSYLKIYKISLFFIL